VERRSTWAAWSLLAVWTASVAVLVTLSAVNGTFRPDAFTDSVPLLLAFATFVVVGALIVRHRPGNAVGWMFAAIALLAVLGALGEEYAIFASARHLPGPVLAAWFASWAWYPTLALTLVFTPLLFPTGRLLSPRWRLVAWPAAAVMAAITGLAALQQTIELAPGRMVANPFGLAGVENPEDSRLGAVLFPLLGPLVLAAFASLVVRFRRSRGDERQQLKWITFAAALLPLTFAGDLLPDTAGNLLFAVVVSFLPVAAGVAILRYRLYEIDRLINRTLVYGLLSALLAGIYATLVLVGGELSGGVADDPPSWAVAGATLAVAALFQPARRRIQQVVDRRFDRRRYDAARTVDAFSGRLREELDLDALAAELLAVVERTVQPTAASLWLRPPARTAADPGPAATLRP
jgi:hypothetical protein